MPEVSCVLHSKEWKGKRDWEEGGRWKKKVDGRGEKIGGGEKGRTRLKGLSTPRFESLVPQLVRRGLSVCVFARRTGCSQRK